MCSILEVLSSNGFKFTSYLIHYNQYMAKVLTVQGSHFQCGKQIGEACRNEIWEIINQSRNSPPEGKSWEDCLNSAAAYITAARQEYPYIIEELTGCAAGIGVNERELFAAAIDELWVKPVTSARHCTDAIICPPAAAEIWVGHNNDLSPGQAELIMAVIWKIDGKPAMFTVGPGGIFISVGINAAGISLTGSELTSNDNRVGVPGGFVARAILNAVTLTEAVKIAENPHRASSYNNIICTPRPGEVVAVEGSATDYELLYPENGILMHTNHYLSPKMRQFEGHPDYVSSITRQKRLTEILTQTGKPISEKTLMLALRDHGLDGIPTEDTVCRHGSGSETAFSTIFNLSRGSVEVAFGFPCRNEFKILWHFPVPNISYKSQSHG